MLETRRLEVRIASPSCFSSYPEAQTDISVSSVASPLARLIGGAALALLVDDDLVVHCRTCTRASRSGSSSLRRAQRRGRSAPDLDEGTESRDLPHSRQVSFPARPG